MPIEPDEGLPKAGDLVEYSCHRGTVTLRVMRVEPPSSGAGYSNVYFEGCSGPTFNINWTTLNANTGTWRIVPERRKPRKFGKPVQPKDLKRVQATDGTDETYEWNGSIWRNVSCGARYTWDDIFEEHPNGVVEVFQTPYEQAVEFFRAGTSLDEAAPLDAFAHARVIIEKAIAGDGG
jgi:hypothetical protein